MQQTSPTSEIRATLNTSITVQRARARTWQSLIAMPVGSAAAKALRDGLDPVNVTEVQLLGLGDWLTCHVGSGAAGRVH
jgi:hypothetical protein